MRLTTSTLPGRLLFILLMFIYISKCLASCKGKRLLRSGVTCKDKRDILDLHNKLRQSVALGQVPNQPPARLMMELTWDDRIAADAQKWANLCKEEHGHVKEDPRFWVGQNLGFTYIWSRSILHHNSKPEWSKHILNWFGEVKDYYMGYRNVFHLIGHYTQLAWGPTFLIGCGYSLYYDPQKGYTHNYVCNYGPGGNIEGRIPYPIGAPDCYSYGVSYSNRYNGLCSWDVKYPLGGYCKYF